MTASQDRRSVPLEIVREELERLCMDEQAFMAGYAFACGFIRERWDTRPRDDELIRWLIQSCCRIATAKGRTEA